MLKSFFNRVACAFALVALLFVQTGDAWYRGSVAGSSTTTDYFNDTGATYPWYGLATYPNAIYISSLDQTWVAAENWYGPNTTETSAGPARRIKEVSVYDHGSNTWLPPQFVSAISIIADDHGVPALVEDYQGYVHMFHGPHVGILANMQHASTFAPGDPSAWRQLTAITGGGYTYPHPISIGSTLYVFMRDTDGVPAPNTSFYGVYTKSNGLASGVVASWDPKTIWLDFGADSRVYMGSAFEDGTDIHIVATKADSGDTERKNAYHFIFDTTDDSVCNSTRSVCVANVDLPIDLATANASFLVFDNGSNYGGLAPALAKDTSGNLHLVQRDGATKTSGTLYHMIFSSGAWSVAAAISGVTVGEYHTAFAIAPLPSAAIEVWYAQPTVTYNRGGDIYRVVRDSGGSWGSVQLAYALTTNPFDNLQAVKSADQSLRVVFSQIQTSGTDVGSLKEYAFADSVVQRTKPNVYTFVNAEASAYNARRATPLDWDWSYRIDKLFTVMKNASLGLSYFDGLYWAGVDNNETDAALNLISNNFNLSARAGDATFSQLSTNSFGYQWVGGTNGSVGTNFTASTASPKVMSQNDINLSFYFNSSGATGNCPAMSTTTTTNSSCGSGSVSALAIDTPTNAATTLQVTHMSSVSHDAYFNGSLLANGFYGVNRTGANAINYSIDGKRTSTNNSAQTSASLPSSELKLFTNGSFYSTYKTNIFGFGKALSESQSYWYYMAGIYPIYAYSGGMFFPRL